MYSLCNQYKINLYELKVDFSGDYINRSISKFWFIRPASYKFLGEIYLGIYKDDELKEISFFHELGHCIMIYPENYLECTEYQIEKMAWKEGLKIAKENGIKFSSKTLKWANEQLKTYSKTTKIKNSKLIGH